MCLDFLLSDVIQKRNKDILNTMFWRMNRYLFIKDSSFINYNENYERLFQKGDQQKIQVEIMGYKKSVTGNLSPIWRILHDRNY